MISQPVLYVIQVIICLEQLVSNVKHTVAPVLIQQHVNLVILGMESMGVFACSVLLEHISAAIKFAKVIICLIFITKFF